MLEEDRPGHGSTDERTKLMTLKDGAMGEARTRRFTPAYALREYMGLRESTDEDEVGTIVHEG